MKGWYRGNRFGTETLEEEEREKLEGGKKTTASKQLVEMADVCKISKESLEKQEDGDGEKGGIGEKIGRTRDREDQTFLHLCHIDLSTRHGKRVIKFAGLMSAKLHATIKIWFALIRRQDQQRVATSMIVYGFVEHKKRWKS